LKKDFIETDKKVNLMESALSSGRILKIFPIPNDANKNGSLELGEAGLKEWILHTQKCIALVFWFFK
jgi:hypothetical protein